MKVAKLPKAYAEARQERIVSDIPIIDFAPVPDRLASRTRRAVAEAIGAPARRSASSISPITACRRS